MGFDIEEGRKKLLIYLNTTGYNSCLKKNETYFHERNDCFLRVFFPYISIYWVRLAQTDTGSLKIHVVLNLHFLTEHNLTL